MALKSVAQQPPMTVQVYAGYKAPRRGQKLVVRSNTSYSELLRLVCGAFGVEEQERLGVFRATKSEQRRLLDSLLHATLTPYQLLSDNTLEPHEIVLLSIDQLSELFEKDDVKRVMDVYRVLSARTAAAPLTRARSNTEPRVLRRKPLVEETSLSVEFTSSSSSSSS
eukprot:CAMPEP_0168581218 /NCGR_PEP_ID=MMETSP0420-20121227/1273_1 /TAXON_ID=498008 /ORGANISM="Pessonella sp." /LENGTH=166 /DNA_ID=CAMNT_0008615507 /DNA_START=36 /DNA_END=533 /DNA_ORIENTATION=-